MSFQHASGFSKFRGLTFTSALLVAASVGLTSCSGPAAGEGDGSSKRIGVSFGHLDQVFFVAVQDGLQKKADEYGYSLEVTDANFDSDEQVNQIQTMITKGVDAIVYMPLDAAAANTAGNLANAANIPIIAIDSKPDDENVKLASYIATNSVESAKQGCSYLAEQMGGSGDMGWIRGILSSTPELERSEGCAQALKNFPNVKKVSDLSADFDQTKGFAAAQNMLSANPNIKAIFAENDAMAQGAAEAAQQAGRDVEIIGMDGFPSTFPYIKDGRITASMSQQPYQMGSAAGDTLKQLFEGGTPEAVQYQDFQRVDASNAAEMQQKLFYGPRFKDEYGK